MKLTETTYLDGTPQIDRESGVLRGVKILGEHSKNGRRYTQEAMKSAVSLYEGKKSYVNHGDKSSQDRKFEDWVSVFRDVHYREGEGLFGDDYLRKSSPHFEGIIEAAERFPNSVGHSHVADGESRLDGDTEIVESIQDVFSVDLVTEPATTNGFFESRTNPMKKITKTVKQIVEDAPKATPKLRRLVEQMDGEMVPPEMEVEVEEEADPAEEVVAALEKAAVAVIRKLFKGEIEEDAAIEQIKKVLGMKDEAAAGAGEAEVPVETATESTKTDPEIGRLREQLTKQNEQLEKVKRESSRLAAKAMLLESGREATDARVKALAAASEKDRKDLLESWPKKETSESYRPDRSPPLYESEEYDSELPEDAEKFAAMIRR